MRNSRNALSHGAFSGALILPDEDPEEFKELHDGLIREHRPEGPTENDAVLDIAKCFWRKRRLTRYHERKVARAAENQKVLDHERLEKAENLRRFLSDAKAGVLPEISPDVLVARFGPAFALSIQSRVPRSVVSTNEAYKRLLVGILATDFNKAGDPHRQPELEEQFSSEAFAASEIDIEERLNAQIEKAFRRIAQSRALKDLFRQSGSMITINENAERLSDERQIAKGLEAHEPRNSEDLNNNPK